MGQAALGTYFFLGGHPVSISEGKGGAFIPQNDSEAQQSAWCLRRAAENGTDASRYSDSLAPRCSTTLPRAKRALCVYYLRGLLLYPYFTDKKIEATAG